MRLTIKLVVWFIACAVLAVAINGFFAVRTELERYESDIAARHVVMGHILRAAFAEVMDTDGEARAVSMLDYTDRRMRLVDIRWVHLDESAPVERRPFAPLSFVAPVHQERDVHAQVAGRLRTYVPLHMEGRPVTALEFSETLDDEVVVKHAVLRELRSVGALTIAIGLASSVLGVLLVARPIRRLVDHARRIGRADLSPMRVASGNDELAELGREMNAMCTQLSEAQNARLKALEQLRHAERLSTVGVLASGLAHELGTPLNVITLRAKAIAQGRAAGNRATEAATSIVSQATRVTTLVRQLLDFARRRSPRRELVEVEGVLDKMIDLVGTVASKANVELQLERPAGELSVRGDAGQLEQVFTNLAMNAIQAMPEGGTVAITTNVVEVTPPLDHGGGRAPYVAITVRDVGCGISPEALPHVFEPFFTTKEVGEGTGLGLAVCYGIVTDHGGFIDVASTEGEGTVFTVYLPEERTKA